jgi:hypothetical protein
MVVVGAVGADATSVFKKNSCGQYEQVSKLVASDEAANGFGSAVVVADGMVVVGATWADGLKTSSGAIYVFEKNSCQLYEQTSKLEASDGATSDRFGNVVAAAHGMLVVGAWGKGSYSGSAYVFEKNSTGQYEQVSKLVASDGAGNDRFGRAVAVVADGMVVVGAYLSNGIGSDSGSVYVFKKNNSTGKYEQVSKLVASDGAANDQFGNAVAAADGIVVVAAHWDDDKGTNSGSVYVFEKNSTEHYVEMSKLVANDGDVNDYFGRAVAVTNDGMVVVGSHYGNCNRLCQDP